MSSGDWQGTGEINRDGAWGFFIIMNFLAIVFNSSLVYSIWRLKNKKTSTEVLIGGLASGIIIGAFGCGPQCLINTVSGTFAYGSHGACFTEAFLHLVGMEIQFICVAAIAHRTYVGVVLLKPYSVNQAVAIVVCAWIFAPCATLLSGNFSRYYLVASGTFCFYEWASPALIFVAWPLAIIAVLTMAYWYWHTFRAFSAVRQATDNHIHSDNGMGRDLAIRLFAMVILLGLGYIGIISQSMYELFIGRAKAWGDIVAAVLVLIFWVSAPFAYSTANRRLGTGSVLLCLPRHHETEWHEDDASAKRSRHISGSMDKKSPPEGNSQVASHATTALESKLPGFAVSRAESMEEDMHNLPRDMGVASTPLYSPISRFDESQTGKLSPTATDVSTDPVTELSGKPLFNPFSYRTIDTSPHSPHGRSLSILSMPTPISMDRSPDSMSPSVYSWPEPHRQSEDIVRSNSKQEVTEVPPLETIVPESE